MNIVSSVPQRDMLLAMMTNDLGRLIERRIEELGISQRAYAARMGMSPSNLNGLLKGKIALPQPDTRRRLAKDLGISHLDLLVMAGELWSDEIPEPGAIREPFPEGDIRLAVLKLLEGITDPHEQGLALKLMRAVYEGPGQPQLEHSPVDTG